MSLDINRRSFLQALIAAGASYVLPVTATEAQVDKVWGEVLANPWYFEINDYGTIVDDGPEDNFWSDIFDIDTKSIKKVNDLIQAIETCLPLQSVFNVIAWDEIDDLKYQAKTATGQALKKIQKKIEALEEYDEPWEPLIEMNGVAGLAASIKKIDEWLQEPVDWGQSEWFPRSAGKQGKALSFFSGQSIELLDLLGVVIIEGDHPGSSYYAAELRVDIDQANQCAEDLGLPFRFRSEAT